MGKRGPKPKPKALRVFEGDPGNLLKSRHENEAEPPRGAVPQPPDWIGEHGSKVWRELSETLHGIGLLTKVDWQAFALYCVAWQEFHEADAMIRAGGLTCMGEKGGEYQHPAVGIRHKAIELINKLGAQFGLSPTSRVGLPVVGHSQQDDLETFKTA